ncbi:class I SAM-dependent methyltransferase [bacterium]|nr:class I SAM-dependent methyltransferase [bacterium]MBU4603118.1 class I SAM-dependent methyltransferase [bacterium]
MSNNTSDKPVKMSQFFNERADVYDQHMKQTVTSFEKFYNIISVPIDRTKEAVEILDLGCGTGLELEGIFSKAPNAVITCMDLSEKMLSKLKSKYSRYLDQIKPVKGSYLIVPFPEKKYD